MGYIMIRSQTNLVIFVGVAQLISETLLVMFAAIEAEMEAFTSILKVLLYHLTFN